MSLFIGVDIGTFESKGVLVRDDGTVLATAAHPHRMLVPQPGWAEHRADEDWWDDLAAITNRLLAGHDATEVRAVGLSAIGACMLPVDAAGRPLCNAVLYGVDTRASAEIVEITERIGRARLLEDGGNLLTSQAVGPKILWLKRNRPELYERAAHIATSTTYLVQRLTGEVVIDHYTASGFAPLYDIGRRSWHAEFCDGIIETSRLPRLVGSTEIVGQVTPAAAALTGLAAGTKVLAGTIDAAAEAFSVGVQAPGEMMLMYGSTHFTILVTKQPLRDERLWYAPWLIDGLHASTAGLATSGTLTHWFREQFARELDRDTAMPTLAAEAAAIAPGADGLVMLPYFSGERTPIHDPHARGMVFGLDLTHTRAHLFRAVLEGIACGVRHMFEPYTEAGGVIDRVAAVGGGTRNPVWLQAVSDIAGMTQDLSERATGASFGDAMLAAIATGAATADDVRRWNPGAGAARPNAALRAQYDRQYATFRALYERTKDLLPR